MIDFERARRARLQRRASALGLDLSVRDDGMLLLYSPDRAVYLLPDEASDASPGLSVSQVDGLLDGLEARIRPI